MEQKKYSFDTGKTNTFTAIDYVLFSAMLVISASIGLFYAVKDRKKVNTKEFLMAGGNMSALPVTLSLLASFMSAITLLGTPAEMYNYTTMYWYIGLGYFFVIAAAAHLFIPVFYNLHLTSAYEYLEMRFSKGVRTAGSVTFCVQMITSKPCEITVCYFGIWNCIIPKWTWIGYLLVVERDTYVTVVLYMAIVLYAPSLALNAVTGFTLWGSVVAVGLVCTLYTTLGGMKAVLWTDSFQVGMMFAGLLAILIQGSIEVGGFKKAWQAAEKRQRIYFGDFSPDPTTRHSFWSLVIGGYFTWVAVYGTNQAQIQRACTCPTLRKAQLALWLNFPGLCIILYLCCLIGIVLFAFYQDCDPLSFKLVSASDQLLPLFVMDILGHVKGIPGLFVACLFSGALSTISSGLNSLSAVVLKDIIMAYFVKDLSEQRATKVSRILAVIFGVICLGLAYVASLLGGVLQAALSLFGMIGGPLLGLFTLGMFFPWANKYGAYTGLLTGLVFMFWIGIGTQVIKPSQPRPPISVNGCNWNLTSTTASYTATTLANVTTLTSTTASYTATTLANVTTLTSTTASYTATTAASSADPLYRLYQLSYLWYSATAVLTVVGVGLLVSLATGRTDPENIDPRLIVPFFDIILPRFCLPEKVRKFLWFGVHHEKKQENINDVSPTDIVVIDPGILEKEINVTAPNENQEKANSFAGLSDGIDNPVFSPPSYDEAVANRNLVTHL